LEVAVEAVLTHAFQQLVSTQMPWLLEIFQHVFERIGVLLLLLLLFAVVVIAEKTEDWTLEEAVPAGGPTA
jgi:hypothetical protein